MSGLEQLLQPNVLAAFAVGVSVGVATALAFFSIERFNHKDPQ